MSGEMLKFLKNSRRVLNATDTVCLVIGNESCDLDSAVSAVSLAYFYQQHPALAQELTQASHFLPVLNIGRPDYPLKTEVRHLFGRCGLTEDTLTFRDELTEDFIQRSDFMLVDHHVSPFAKRCVAVFDHRPRDSMAVFPEHCQLHMELVGSCATLVGELLLMHKNEVVDSTVLTILRSTIILDTVNFAVAAGRFTPKDADICSGLEEAILSSGTHLDKRVEVFQALVKARADVSELTPMQLLRKDMKLLSTVDGSIALPGFPLLVQHFIEKPDADAAVAVFAKEFDCAVVLLLGMFVAPDGTVERDIGVINISNQALSAAVLKALLDETRPAALGLELHADCQFLDGFFYRQTNVKATRKHILPVVKAVLSEWASNNRTAVD